MMKLTIAFLLIGVALSSPAGEKYTEKYDGIDLDQILGNDRLLNGYIKCLTNKGNCTPDGTQLKGILPEALQTDCEKCTDQQKTNSKKVLTFLLENKYDSFVELEGIYDKDGEYKKRYCALARKHGVEVSHC